MNRHLRIAVVDDDTTLLAMLNELLTEEGFVVSAFTDGEQAQRAAYHSGFDIVLTDINMPQVTGVELLRYLREIGSKALVIMMTANADVQSAIEAVRLGAYDYLQKPFDDIQNVVGLVNRAADKILNESRQDQMVQAVIEKTKQLISYQKPQDLPDDLEDLLARTEAMVKNLTPKHSPGDDHQITGDIDEIGLANLLQMLSIVGKTGKLLLFVRGAPGEIWFTNGRMVHAQIGRVKGTKAIFRLLAQAKGSFRFVLSDHGPLSEEISTSTDGLILDGLRCMDEYKRLGRRVPPRDLCLRVKPPIPGQIGADDRTTLEMILRYTRVGDILDYSSRQDLDVVHSLIRLRMAGVLEIYYTQ